MWRSSRQKITRLRSSNQNSSTRKNNMGYLERLKSYKEEMTETLRESVSKPSVNGDPVRTAEGELLPFGRGVHDALIHMLDKGRELGFEVINDAVTAVSGVLSRYRKGNEQFCRTEQGVFWIVGSSSEEEYFADYSGRAFIEECRKQLLTIDEKNTIQPEMAVFYEYTGDRPLESLVKTLEFKLSKKHLNDRRHTFHIHNIHDLRTELYRHPEQKWSIEQMAQTVMLSRTHFQRIYRQTFGISASADLINARIKHAKELLLLGNSITVTAELCGYSSGDYFMHQFKKMTGMTPSEWLDGKRNVYSDPTV